MVVRDECGRILDINKTSTTQLYCNHSIAQERITRAQSQNQNRNSRTMNKHSHNLVMNMHAFVCKQQEDADLLFTLYDGDKMKPITENYVVRWSRQGLAMDLDQLDNHQVVFSDLGLTDLNLNKIYLVCSAIRLGAMDVKEGEAKRNSVLNASGKKFLSSQLSNSSGNFSMGKEKSHCDIMRRPFGVAAVDLTPIIKKPDEFKSNIDMPFIL